MTLGNGPQPLTRRQLRELARENEPVAVDDERTAPDATAESAHPSTGSHSRHTTPSLDTPVEAKRDEPKQDQPKQDQRKQDQPKQDQPKKDQPKKDQQKDASKREEKSAVKSAKDKPSTDKSSSDKTRTDKSSLVKTSADTPSPNTLSAAHLSAVEPETVKPASVRQAPAPLPIPDAAPSRTPVVIDSVVVDPGHNLTRRELRALQAAASASATPSAEPPRAATPVSAPAPVADTHAADTHAADKHAADTNAVDKNEVDQPASAATPAPAPTGLTPPLGHWSLDRDDDSHIETIGRRDDQTFDDLVGRGIGAGGIPTTTNALILPAIPRQGNSGPITSTGEIMITGSIDLPRSLGATGQHPNLFDSSEMDRMLDQLDEGGHHNDVAPVSASRAVSTHTSTRGVMTPPRKRGASLPTVLAITAAVLAIGVLSLFVVGYAFNIY